MSKTPDRPNPNFDLSLPEYRKIYQRNLDLLNEVITGNISPHEGAYRLTIQELRLTRTDPMTGLLNKGGFHDALQAAIALAKSTGKPVSVIYLDGRRFKKINDHPKLGHEIGDRVIHEMGVVIGKTRSADIKGRFSEDEDDDLDFTPLTAHPSRDGGDEFALVAFESLHTTVRLAKRLKRDIAAHVNQQIPEIKRHIRGGFRVSTGTAELRRTILANGDTQYEDWRSLLSRADEQMYAEREIESNPLKRIQRVSLRLRDSIYDQLTHLHFPSRNI
jgi:GGDEF domain-containing protein